MAVSPESSSRTASPSLARALAQDFGLMPGCGPWGRDLAVALYAVLARPAAIALLTRWEADFAPPASRKARAEEACAALRTALALAPDGFDPSRALLAIQTMYAIILKSMAWRMLSPIPAALLKLDSIESIAALHAAMDTLESGRAAQAAGITQLIEPDLFSWYVSPAFWQRDTASAVVAALTRVSNYDLGSLSDAPAGGGDLFRALYQACIPAPVRHALGEFYTPRWLVQAVLAEVPAPEGWRALDPCCGSGAFVVELIAEILAETADAEPGARLTAVLGRVAGLDLNPLAVLGARVNVWAAIAPLHRAAGQPPIRLPVYLGEASGGHPAIGPRERVVGNPPWVSWKDLPGRVREAIGTLYADRGLRSGEGYSGGTDLNVCAVIAHAALERWVAPAGHLGFLMPRQLLQLRSARGFRRWRLPDGRPLHVRSLADWTALRPFEAACAPMTYVIGHGAGAPGPVPLAVQRAVRRGDRPMEAAWSDVAAGVAATQQAAWPSDADGGPYLLDAPEALPELAALLGPCPYRGRRATETSPHGVYWVRAAGPVTPDRPLRVENALNPRAKDGVVREQFSIEPDWLHPLLRGQGIRRFAAQPEAAWVIFPHDAASGAETIAAERLPPLTRAYLERHRERLEARGSYREYRAGKPFYGLWRVGPYTFAPYKVVWPEMGELRAAVIARASTPWGAEKLVIPEGKINLIGCDDAAEAHYLCALLNAPRVRRAYEHLSSQIGRPSRLPFALPSFDAARWSHRALAASSRAAHLGAGLDARFEARLDWLLVRALRGA